MQVGVVVGIGLSGLQVGRSSLGLVGRRRPILGSWRRVEKPALSLQQQAHGHLCVAPSLLGPAQALGVGRHQTGKHHGHQEGGGRGRAPPSLGRGRDCGLQVEVGLVPMWDP